MAAMSAAACGLHALAITDGGLQPAELRALTEALPVPTPLTTLDLSCQALTSAALSHLLDAAARGDEERLRTGAQSHLGRGAGGYL